MLWCVIFLMMFGFGSSEFGFGLTETLAMSSMVAALVLHGKY